MTRACTHKSTTLIDVRLAPQAAQKPTFPNYRFVPGADIGGGLFISVFSTWPFQTALVFQLELTADYASRKVEILSRQLGDQP
jgi:hypothetical protein